MRLNNHQWLKLGLLVLGIVVSTAHSQRPDGGRSGKGGKGMFGGRMPTPEEIFKQLSKGNATIDVNTVEQPPEWGMMGGGTEKMRAGMREFLEKKGIKDGKLTLSLYQDYSAERSFRRMSWGQETIDVNKLRPGWGMTEEKIANMKALLEKKGIKDGKMTVAVYTEFVRSQPPPSDSSRSSSGKEESRSASSKPSPRKEEDNSGYRTAPVVKVPDSNALDARPTVFRYGKLPTRDLPSWFSELDTDKDGQIGLYEWRAGGKTSSEFKKFDLNGDGFVTAEEMIVVQKVDDSKSAKGLTFSRVNADFGTEGVPPNTSGSASSSSSDKKGRWGDKGDREEKGKKGKWGRWGK